MHTILQQYHRVCARVLVQMQMLVPTPAMEIEHAWTP